LDKSGRNNNFNIIEESIQNYKDELLSSYWTEINLIGYKIELLEKQKVEYPKELKNRIIYIGNKIFNKSYYFLFFYMPKNINIILYNYRRNN